MVQLGQMLVQLISTAPTEGGWQNHKQAGSINASFMVGGQSQPGGESCKANAHQGWDGTAWSAKEEIPLAVYQHGAAGTPQASFFVGGQSFIGYAYPSPFKAFYSSSYKYEEDLTTGSFGRLEFISASGDATGLQS